MTKEELEAIDVLLNAATPGPWVVDTNQDGFFVRGVGARDPIGLRGQDAVLIAIARKALPELIAEVRRLRALVSDMGEIKEAITEGLNALGLKDEPSLAQCIEVVKDTVTSEENARLCAELSKLREDNSWKAEHSKLLVRANERGYIAKRLVEEFGGGSAACNCKEDVAQIAEWIRKGEM